MGTFAAARLHLARRLAYSLDDERDGAPVAVEIRDRERNPLAALVQYDDDELPGFRRARQERRLDFEQEGDVGEVLPPHDREAVLVIGHDGGSAGAGGALSLTGIGDLLLQFTDDRIAAREGLVELSGLEGAAQIVTQDITQRPGNRNLGPPGALKQVAGIGHLYLTPRDRNCT